MARKQNQKALYEAIRQGQMKIAEGLKTGQMRSDRRRFTSGASQNRLYGGAEMTPSDETEYEYSRPAISSKALLIGAAVVIQAVILILGIWFGAMFFKDRGETVPPTDTPAVARAETPETSRRSTPPVMSVPDREAGPVSYQVRETPTATPVVSSAKTAPPVVQAPPPPVSTGGNVIVIQGIQERRKDELLPLRDYFAKKGIETEVIVRNGYGLLVTKAGFDVNPESRGTPGFELMQRIRQLGIAYPQETGDTKFGLKPFQDSYGLLK
jgi:hypothetical protein